jgi:hypothetical protein
MSRDEQEGQGDPAKEDQLLHDTLLFQIVVIGWPCL